MPDVASIDSDLAKLTRRLERAEGRSDLGEAAIIEGEIDRLLDQRNETSWEDVPND